VSTIKKSKTIVVSPNSTYKKRVLRETTMAIRRTYTGGGGGNNYRFIKVSGGDLSFYSGEFFEQPM